jgi:molecular chaperone GrpE
VEDEQVSVDASVADDAHASDVPASEAADSGTALPDVDLEARAVSDPRSRVELVSDLEAMEQQRDEYLDGMLRAHADFENYRKRVTRDGAVQREHGRTDVVLALLEVLDDVDRIVVAVPDADDPVGAAVRLVAEKAQRALAGLGVERIDTAGVAFDPTVHDAVQQVEVAGDSAAGVHQILRPGYRLGDRVLRAAMVVVAQ